MSETPKTPRRTSADFHVGQVVFCPQPENFLSGMAKYLAGRQGVVIEVTPVTRPHPNYCGHINRVYVEWQKRGGRGKVKSDYYSPRDIEAWVAPDAPLQVP